MDATTMQFANLIKKVKVDYPWVKFVEDDIFKWSPSTSSVHYSPLKSSSDVWSLLHELSHAILGHQSFERDIELLKKEVEAWQHARDNLAPVYQINIPSDKIDDELETYRDWLHDRSTCPKCTLNGLQTDVDVYKCLNCTTIWQVNDARKTGLKRQIKEGVQ